MSCDSTAYTAVFSGEYKIGRCGEVESKLIKCGNEYVYIRSLIVFSSWSFGLTLHALTAINFMYEWRSSIERILLHCH